MIKKAFLFMCLTAAVQGVAASSAVAAPPFSPSSFWNTPVARDAPIDPTSPLLVAELQRERAATSTWLNTTSNSSPLYTVPSWQPTTRVTLDGTASPALQAAFNAVPLPANAQPAAGGDGNLVLWQPSTDTMWEFWHLRKQVNGWYATWGGRKLNASSDPGYYRDRVDARGSYIERWFWGAPATSLPLAAGIITMDELRAGHIDHALQIALPQPRKGVFAAPALRTDGNYDSPVAIPEGARLRLDPTLDLSKLQMPRVTRLIAEAAQRYGIIVDNVAGCVAFRAEDPTPTGTNPYPAWFGYQTPKQLLASFPWDRLQVLKMNLTATAG